MNKIAVGFDGSDESRDALHFGDRLARLEGAELQVAAAGLFEPQMTTAADANDSQAALRRLFAVVEDEIGPRRFSPIVLEGLSAARVLIDHAEAEGVDLIVVGSTHRGKFGQVLPGSVGAQLLHGSPCPVAIAPRGFSGTRGRIFGRIGVAFDASRESELALEEAARLARLLDVDLRVITVVPGIGAMLPPPPVGAEPTENLRRRFTAALEEGVARVGEDVDVDPVLVDGDPARALVGCSREVDLLVLGSRGRGLLRRTALGSVSAHVLASAECPVVVVPRGAQMAVETLASAGAA